MDTTIFFSEPLLMVYLWIFFIIVAEWKKDFVYFAFCSVIALILGVDMIGTWQIHYIYGVVVLLASVYFSILAFHYGMEWNKGRLNE